MHVLCINLIDPKRFADTSLKKTIQLLLVFRAPIFSVM